MQITINLTEFSTGVTTEELAQQLYDALVPLLNPPPPPAPPSLREQLAAIEHERWADWQRYLHGRCEAVHGPGGTYAGLLIPVALVEHWERQIATPYAQLSEREQASDMEQVDRYWPLLVAACPDLDAQ